MISCDTNILYTAYNASLADHTKAFRFIQEHRTDREFMLCEQVLMEFYCLLRNPALSARALTPEEAVHVIQTFRTNPAWRIVDVITHQRERMDRVWQRAAERNFAYRKIFDLRLAETLIGHGVTDFATRNLKDFAGCGFTRLFDPCL